MAKRKLGRQRFVVGVDFGTTYSGAAFTFSANGANTDKIEVIKSWPGGNKTTSLKVPTEILYGNEALQWGYGLERSPDIIRCVKLLLDPSQELPTWVNREEMMEILIKLGKTPTEVVTDYLREMRAHIVKCLVERWGDGTEPAIDYILTVPAVWSNAAKDATLTAAIEAGMGSDVSMITEPEAAAVYALSTRAEMNAKAKEVYIVCDAGGGTVDLITYEIQKLSPLSFREVVPGTGGLSGASFLNLAFERHLKSRLQKKTYAGLLASNPHAIEVAREYFEEHVKRSFDGVTTKRYQVPLPGVSDSPEKGILGGCLSLSGQQVMSIFDPLVGQIIGLIEEQRKNAFDAGKPAQKVILVGGFGQSDYLSRKIQEHFSNRVVDQDGSFMIDRAIAKPPALSLIRPSNSWTAVVQGSVLRGVSSIDLVTSRKARCCYGFDFQDPWENNGGHSKECKVWDNLEECYFAQNRMDWVIRKGDDVETDRTYTLNLHYNFDFELAPEEIVVILYRYRNNNPPSAVDGAGVERCCEFTIPTAVLPAKTLRNSHDVEYRCFKYQLVIFVESTGLLKYELRAGGKVRGVKTVKFE